MVSSIDYYNKSSLDFYNNTVNADMREHYHIFEQYLPIHGHVLDAGCGSGRDSLYFRNKGYSVVAFDASEEMVRLSSKLTGLRVECAKFDEFEYSGQFDGIWACASLLHVYRSSITGIINRFTSILRKDGVMYMSFKYGDQVYSKNGRLFNCYNEKAFNELIINIPELRVAELYKTADVRDDRTDEYWLSAILQKK